MATRKSLVYLDDVVQRALKDVLIPVLGYRDTSRDFGRYTDDVEYLRADVSALQVKDKGKIYVHGNMSQPINIYIPDTRYNSTGESTIEPIDISVEFKKIGYSDNTNMSSELMSVVISIPGGFTVDSNGLLPYCKACNKSAVEFLKNAYVKVLTDYNKKPSKVLQLYFPKVNADTVSEYTRGIITVYSQHRECEKVNTWDGVIGTEEGVNIINECEVTLGTVPYFSDVENKDKLVRSNTIKEIEGVTSAVYNYLDDADDTVPTTLYHERQDDNTRVTGTLTFRNAKEVQDRKDILIDIFGTDWSEVDVQFNDDVTDIGGAFQGFTFTSTPRSIRGLNVKKANALFKDSKIAHITNQEELFKGLPKLEYLNSCFENTPLADSIEEVLLKSNNRLSSIHFCFRNTKITNTFEFWNMTHEYTPDRENSLSSLEHSPGLTYVRLEGTACYEGVTTLSAEVLSKIPNIWKSDTRAYSYMSMAEFMIKRGSLLEQYSYDLSQVTITIEEKDADLNEMFEGTLIKKAPKAIVSPSAIRIDSMFCNCLELIELYSSTVAQLTSVTSASRFTYGCSKLRTYPTDIFVPLKGITSFNEAMAYLTAVTGPIPTVNGKQLWELEGTEGYPELISGYDCYTGSTFDNVSLAPTDWRGANAYNNDHTN